MGLRDDAIRAQQGDEGLDAVASDDESDILVGVAAEARQHCSGELLGLERGVAAATKLRDEPLDCAGLGDGSAVVGVLGKLDEHARDVLLALSGA